MKLATILRSLNVFAKCTPVKEKANDNTHEVAQKPEEHNTGSCIHHEELSSSAFDVYEEDGEWRIITATCCLGGCDYRWIAFPTKEQAKSHAMELTLRGEKPWWGGACPECYAEYMEDCL